MPVCEVWLLPMLASVWPEVSRKERHGWNRRSFLRIEEASNPPSVRPKPVSPGPVEGPERGPLVSEETGPSCVADEAWSLSGLRLAADESADEGSPGGDRTGGGSRLVSRSSAVPGCEYQSAHFQVSYARLLMTNEIPTRRWGCSRVRSANVGGPEKEPGRARASGRRGRLGSGWLAVPGSEHKVRCPPLV
jgi:hypothetical protein